MNARQTAAAEKREALLADLHDKVESLTKGEAWLNYLAFAQKFRRYSVNNQILIWLQRPEAEHVAGFKKWQEMGRQVRKGSKAIQILGFREYEAEVEKDGQTVKERRAYFPAVNVFDYADTDPIEGAEKVFEPSDLGPVRLTGEDAAGIYSRVESWLIGQGWTVERRELGESLNGFTTIDGTRKVVIHSGVEDAQAAKTMIHEAAHVILHTEDGKGDSAAYVAHRGIHEVEAESVAYVVAGVLGLDTSAYSVGYVAQWAEADHDLIHATATRVMQAAKTLADALESEPVAVEVAA